MNTSVPTFPKATIVLTDGAAGVDYTLTFEPALTPEQEQHSQAVQTAKLLERLLLVSRRVETQQLRLIALPLNLPQPGMEEKGSPAGTAGPRESLAMLYGYAFRQGLREELEQFIKELFFAYAVPNTRPETWSAELLREVLSRFKQIQIQKAKKTL